MEALHKLQTEEGLHAGNKLRQAHIDYQRNKMKVNLASQTCSASVADALEYCENDLHLPQFTGCAATVKFLRIIDRCILLVFPEPIIETALKLISSFFLISPKGFLTS